MTNIGRIASVASTLALATGLAHADAARAQVASNPAQPATSPSQSVSPEPARPAREGDAIVVTGTRIARRDYVSPSPIVTVGADALQRTGQVTIGEALNQLPQLSAGFGSTSPGQNDPEQSGRTFSDLRGLGPTRTLVLLDGRRVEPSDSFNRVDLSVIPDALVDNVEIITGGASATYGSDAIAGVINFKLKNRFSGVAVDGQFGRTTRGDGNNYAASILLGANAPDDRGNVVLGLSYSQRDAVGGGSRDYFNGLALTTFPAYGVAFLSPPNLPSQAAVNSVFGSYGFAPGTVSNNEGFAFNANGSLFNMGPTSPITNRQPLPGEVAVTSGGVAQDAAISYFQLQAPIKKYSVFTKGDYEIAPGITAYAQAFYTTYRTQFTLSPIVITVVPVTNPFIPADLQTLLASRPAPTAPILYLELAPTLTGVTEDKSDLWQVTAGLRGKLGLGDVTWDVYATKGRSQTIETNQNVPLLAPFTAAVNAPDGGASICTGGVDLFPFTSLSAECRAKLLGNVRSVSTVDQEVVEGVLQGGLFRLLDGDVRFAAGATYRRNGFNYQPDASRIPNPVTGQVGYLDNFLGPQVPGKGSIYTKEVFGELSATILKDRPFAKELNIDAGYRYSDYNLTGGISTYKVNAIWSPASLLMLRGGYQRAVRAPAPGELFAPSIFGSDNIGIIASGGGDPCSITSAYRNGANATQVRALCIAQGVPTAVVDTYQTAASIVGVVTSGNPNLKAEVSDSWTAGAVFKSPFRAPALSRLTLSVDYYKIKLDGAIGSLTGGQILSKCFNADGSNPSYSETNIYCQLITRNNGTSGTGTPGGINQIQKPTLNLAQYKVSGVDVQLDWSSRLADLGLGDSGAVRFNSVISYVGTYAIRNTSSDPLINYAGTIGNNQIGGFSHPKWKAMTSLDYILGRLDVGVRWRFIDKMSNSISLVTGQPAQGVPVYNYFDFNARFGLTKSVTLRAGLLNAFDKKPPIYSTSYPYTDGATYDVLGRSFYVGASFKF